MIVQRGTGPSQSPRRMPLRTVHAAALAVVDDLVADGRLARYPYLPATRADLLERLGRTAEAVVAYAEALALTDNAAEQEHLRGRITALDDQP